MKKYALIVAGGKGVRMGNAIPKQFLILNSLPVLMHTIKAFYAIGGIEIVLVLPQHQFDYWQSLCKEFSFTIPHQLISGGDSRFHSVRNGLAVIDNNSLVAIHDGVRPMISAAIINQSFEVANKEGNAIAAIALKDSLREQLLLGHTRSVNRANYYLVQTPQTFKSDIIKKAYQEASHENFSDDAGVAEEAGVDIKIIAGSDRNIKITTPEDLLIASVLISQ